MGSLPPATTASFQLDSPFFLQLNKTLRRVTIPAIIDCLKSTGRYHALSWIPETAKTKVHCFWDSDTFKSMEAFCYFLMQEDEPELRKNVEEIVSFIKSAQWDDGYVNSYYTLEEPGKRFTNLRDMHELYSLGHLAEFAVAYYQLTGSRELIEVVRRFVLLLQQTVIPKGGYPGHQELELALMRLYDATQDELYLKTVSYLVRGRGKHDEKDLIYYDRECMARGGDPFTDPGWGSFRHYRDYAYMQAHVPLIEQQEIDGHCVRAIYFLIGALDYAYADNASDLKDAVEGLFTDTITKKLYITGGLGALKQNEGFGPAYHLPDLQHGSGCYSETCASFGLVTLCQRFLRRSLDSKYADVMERALLNCVLGALGMEGASFFYENPLATVPELPWRRSKWFNTSCCPPNIVKTWGLLSTWMHTVYDDTLAIHMYIASTINTLVDGSPVQVEIQGGVPWSGKVRVSVHGVKAIRLALRIPDWCRNCYTCSKTGVVKNGYLYVDVEEQSTIDLNFNFEPHFVHAHPKTRKEEVAIARGPIIYCAETPDNDFDLENIFIDNQSPILSDSTIDIIGVETPLLVVSAWERSKQNQESLGLYRTEAPPALSVPRTVKLIPFFLRENRGGSGGMRVWMKSRV